MLEAAKTAIDQKTREAYDEFRQRVTHDFQAVEQRTQGLSTNVAERLREHLNRGLGELHQEIVDAGNRLKRLSDDLLGVMERSLGEEHEAHRKQLEQVRETVSAEALRLQEQISVLDGRMAKLDESARSLESGLDQRLSKMASDTVRTARGHMEGALEVAMNELATRSAQELGSQLDETSANLKIVQKELEASVTESLKIQISDTLQSFECRMDELAQKCVERWRIAFAGGLKSLVKMLGEQFVLQAAADDGSELSSTEKPRGGARK
jgi:predicted  nucleic acid-binding Zn-ribbon protein